MSSLDLQLHDQAIQALTCGDLIAYPTEAVWGLGCDHSIVWRLINY